MIKMCIFDLDGTLLNTLPTISGIENMALEEFGYEAIEPEEVKYMIGYGAGNLIRSMLERAGGDLDKEFDKVYKFFMKNYNKGVTEGTKPYDGVPELLSELKTRRVSTPGGDQSSPFTLRQEQPRKSSSATTAIAITAAKTITADNAAKIASA